MRQSLLVVTVVVLTTLAGACAATPTPTLTSIMTSTPASPSSTAASKTFGQVAGEGATVFATYCAGCHGDQGQGRTGPRLIGPDSDLDDYESAQGLLDFISQAMPWNAPGTLTRQDYLNVLGFLLVRNNYVSTGTTFDANQLSGFRIPDS